MYVIYVESKELYRRSPTGILLHCITIEEGRKLLEDLPTGACGHHASPRTLVGNAFRQVLQVDRGSSLMPSNSFAHATGANFTPSKPTSLLRHCR